MALPEDILWRIEQDYPDAEDRALVTMHLSNLPDYEPIRVARCILFAAAGDLGMFMAMEKLARLDYRDVIMNGEYEPGSDRPLRDLNQPFPRSYSSPRHAADA